MHIIEIAYIARTAPTKQQQHLRYKANIETSSGSLIGIEDDFLHGIFARRFDMLNRLAGFNVNRVVDRHCASSNPGDVSELIFEIDRM